MYKNNPISKLLYGNIVKVDNETTEVSVLLYFPKT